MNNFLANVAIPVPLQQLFTYSIPENLHAKIRRGSIVTVQFGKKKVNGVVVSFPQTSSGFSLKPILDTIDGSLTLNEEQLRLAEWLSDYYLAPIGETIKLFLPVGFHQTMRRIVSLVNKYTESPKLTPAQKKIVTVLNQKNNLSLLQLQKRAGIKNIYSVTNELASSGIIKIIDQFDTSPKPKMEWIFISNNTAVDAGLKGKNQQTAWKKIAGYPVGKEVLVTEFLRETKLTLSTLQSLEKKKLISLKQQEASRKSELENDESSKRSLSITLNTYQQQSADTINEAIDSGKHQTFLLHGITGSGKTQVYIEAIKHALQQNKSSIVLIPEIALTPQTVRRFQIHFGDLVVWVHSKMSVGERYDAWRLSKEGKYKIVIGPRSALFAPLHNIGLIIVDEEHESSYKQFDSSPRYNARDTAIVKASFEKAIVILGSATPSIESFANAQVGKYILLTLPERADNAQLPPVTIIDMIEERKKVFAELKEKAKILGKKVFENSSRSISSSLELKIKDRIDKKEKIILLQNRRGFAPFLECNDCGYIEQCDRCSVTMTYHAPQKHLRCHYCGKVNELPSMCPKCKGHQLSLHGFGTQRVEQELTVLFPDAKILRMDLDTTIQKNSHDKILKQFGEGNADILLGTQMVAKGLDFPQVTLVGVISADTQMMLPDFRSAERTFQLLTQVAGRAGRSTLGGEVIIQTSQSSHYALAHVKDHNYISFFNEEIEYRKALKYPPFSRIVVIEVKGKSEEKVQSVATVVGKKILSSLKFGTMLGPSPAALSKVKNEFRWQIIVKADKEKDKNASNTRNIIAQSVREIQKSIHSSEIKILIDVDPSGIM